MADRSETGKTSDAESELVFQDAPNPLYIAHSPAVRNGGAVPCSVCCEHQAQVGVNIESLNSRVTCGEAVVLGVPGRPPCIEPQTQNPTRRFRNAP
jgi:hypothetical protein